MLTRAEKPVRLVQEIRHVAEDLKRRIVGQVFLKVTVAALHRAVAGKIHHSFTRRDNKRLHTKCPFL